ncbi:hypothetical protein FC96_GL001869 [Secundilactobacillus kimchicus JCM 15530]|uniref:Helix-turn-helix type 11 domain-containing protein n=3 Tax=Secundilactobacillus kimchicus TaxID=528209 RepID=A0A0R1HRB6_9LACO|nr:hypothetical protein FC96_GL001869 [Secundilactobacillus kimchicus JCM 15530]
MDLAVLKCLHVGATSKVTMKELKLRTQMSQRAIYDAIEVLRASGIPIMASRQGNNGGYFIAETENEKQAGIAQYKKQIATEQRNLKALQQAELSGWQMALEDDKTSQKPKIIVAVDQASDEEEIS